MGEAIRWRFRCDVEPAFEKILTPAALNFLCDLTDEFRPQLKALLERRKQQQASFDRGELPDFRAETKGIRDSDWRVAEIPNELLERHVEITGPVDRKMIINALNSGANVFMADFEDSSAPTWENMVTGQINLIDAVRRSITYEDHERKKSYQLGPRPAVLMVRPRGLHLFERHLEIGGEPIPGSLFDFGLFLFHNAKELVRRGTGPYFYLPKLQSHLEARYWNQVIVKAQQLLGLKKSTVRVTVLIETLPAAFEMHEILYELRDHIVGLNCGRWDYLFSFMKTMRAQQTYVLPDRSSLTMAQPCMRAYTQLLIQTCHRRGAFAMGGMAAQIPIKNDEARNTIALAKVREDKLREVKDGHDGTWVAHPGLVALAKEIFAQNMTGPNQLANMRGDVVVGRDDLLRVPEGAKTLQGLQHNVSVAMQYLSAWLSGQGCVPIFDLMEDAATAEISRCQIWQWHHFRIVLDSKERVSAELIAELCASEADKLRTASHFSVQAVEQAQNLFNRMVTSDVLDDFLTIPAYEFLVRRTIQRGDVS